MAAARAAGRAGTKPEASPAPGKAANGTLNGKKDEKEALGKDEKAASRRGRLIRLALLAVSLLVIIGVVAFNRTQERTRSAGDQAGPTQRPAAKPGEVLERANLAASVIRVNRNFVHPDPAIKPESGKRFVVVEFRLTNKDAKAVKISAARHFKLRDSSQTRYEVSPVGAPDPKFPDGTLAPGQTVSGWIAFQIPQKSKGLRLLFNPAVPV